MTQRRATPEHFRPLLGEWVRPDGGYVLVVRQQFDVVFLPRR